MCNHEKHPPLARRVAKAPYDGAHLALHVADGLDIEEAFGALSAAAPIGTRLHLRRACLAGDKLPMDEQLAAAEADFVVVEGSAFDAPARTPRVRDLDELRSWSTEHLATLIASAVPPIRVLVLAGGRSERMGEDKAGLCYRGGETELERLCRLGGDLGCAVAVSLRPDSEVEVPASVEVIPDRFAGLGSVGGILSAMMRDPNSAWLVLACDLPLLDAATLRRLIGARRAGCYATAVHVEGRRWPEPLCTIYEPRAYGRLLQLLSLGYACGTKLLINSRVATVEVPAAPLTNANTPEEAERVRGVLARA